VATRQSPPELMLQLPLGLSVDGKKSVLFHLVSDKNKRLLVTSGDKITAVWTGLSLHLSKCIHVNIDST